MSRVMADSEAEGITRLVLLVMANRAGGDHDECFASILRLGVDCRVHDRTVQRAIRRLVVLGDLEHVGVHPKYRSNVYRVMPGATMAESHPPGDPGSEVADRHPQRVAESHPPGDSGSERVAPVPPELELELGSKGSIEVRGTHYSHSRDETPVADALFDNFWAVYPLHKDKGHARLAFKAACKRAHPDGTIAGALRYRDDPDRDPTKTKYAQGWLSGDRWLDERVDPQEAALRLLRGGTSS